MSLWVLLALLLWCLYNAKWTIAHAGKRARAKPALTARLRTVLVEASSGGRAITAREARLRDAVQALVDGETLPSPRTSHAEGSATAALAAAELLATVDMPPPPPSPPSPPPPPPPPPSPPPPPPSPPPPPPRQQSGGNGTRSSNPPRRQPSPVGSGARHLDREGGRRGQSAQAETIERNGSERPNGGVELRLSEDFDLSLELQREGFAVTPERRIELQMERLRSRPVFGILENKLLAHSLLRHLGAPTQEVAATCAHAANETHHRRAQWRVRCPPRATSLATRLPTEPLPARGWVSGQPTRRHSCGRRWERPTVGVAAPC